MFEDRTYENIMAECLATAPQGIDLRQGGIFYDAVAAACVKIAQFYTDIRTVFDLVFVTTAVDEYLDRKGAEFGVARNPATCARFSYQWAGSAEPSVGERFFADGLYFALKRDGGALILEAETPGSACNRLAPGTAAVPVRQIAGLERSAFGALAEPGADAETDEAYRKRIQEKIAGPAENGNRQHYKTWCESVPGVGRARIVPLFAGENTVMGVLIGTDGLPAAQSVVDRVQAYIDPMTIGKTVLVDGELIPVGDGLGDGVANIGAHFAAVAPSRLELNISFAAELSSTTTPEQIQADAAAALTAYLKSLAFETNTVVRVSAISSMLYALPGLIDYTALTINGGTANLELSDRQVAVLGEVVVHAIV